MTEPRKLAIWGAGQLVYVFAVAVAYLAGAYFLAWLVTSCVPTECPPPRRDAGITVRVLDPMVPDPYFDLAHCPDSATLEGQCR